MMPNQEKLVSVGLPVRNGGSLFKGALDALLSQTYRNIEFIISDNASEDDTPSLSQSYAEKDKRLKYFRQKENIGFARNWAFVLNEARGEYFMWAAHDDWWDPAFVGKMVKALEENPNHVVAMSHFKVSRPGSEELEDTPLGEHDFTALSNSQLYKTMLSAKDNPIFEYGLWRRKFLLKLFSRLKPRCIEDTVILMSEAALAVRFYSVKEFLHVKYRDPRPLRERHYLGDYYKKPFPYTKFIWTGLRWHLTSGVIPFRRKLLVLRPWLGKAWFYKRKILKEWFGFIK